MLLDRWGVLRLFSPPRTPRYNGSCEAGIGSMKVRTHHQAALRGSPGEWTCDDAEAARRLNESRPRPWGSRGPTPSEAWEGRRPVAAGAARPRRGVVRRRARERGGAQGYPEDGR